MLTVLIVVIVLLVALFFVWMNINNGIVRADNKCDAAWQTIDAQLQRRNDLIPNVVESVKGYAAHESKTLDAVTSARAAVAAAKTPEAKMEASNQLSSALRGLFAVAEAYPELKANTNFLDLQQQLKDTEDRISYARMSYNDVVMDYNNAIQTFPGSLIAGGRAPRTGFTVDDAAVRQAPQVKF